MMIRYRFSKRGMDAYKIRHDLLHSPALKRYGRNRWIEHTPHSHPEIGIEAE